MASVSVLTGPTFGESAPTVTVLPATTYTANATWTLANSPYVLDGDVTVSAGATLTVEPGVVVKLNGQLRRLTVNGVLKALGTASSRIVFSSYQDDTAGGDTNGDGAATSGALGQWVTDRGRLEQRRHGAQVRRRQVRRLRLLELGRCGAEGGGLGDGDGRGCDLHQ